MLKVIFTIVLIIHGSIHLMGFLKAYEISKIEQLHLSISKPFGALWLLAAVVFALACILYICSYKYWWVVSLLAILLSQYLIIVFWADAKFGTIANVLILLPTIAGVYQWQFHNAVEAQLRQLLPMKSSSTSALKQEELQPLPPIVKKWLTRSNVVGKRRIQTAFITQEGQMRTSPDGRWMPFVARQWFRVDKPGFLWSTKVQAGFGLELVGRDLFLDGRGHMLIKLMSLFPVANEGGPKIDQGTLLRYLSEVVWLPSAAVSPFITWKEGKEPHQAIAEMKYKGLSGTGTFTFTEAGDFSSFQASRYYKETLEDWWIQVDKDRYKEYEGIRIPTHLQVTWKLKGGDFTWYKVAVTNARYNILPSQP